MNWSIASENRQAIELLNQWAPMDVEDALELLSPNFTHPVVRKYAITRLKQACDEDLLLYLLQLVQALKYENFECIKAAYNRMNDDDTNSIGSRIEKAMSDLTTKDSCNQSSDFPGSLTASTDNLGNSINEGNTLNVDSNDFSYPSDNGRLGMEYEGEGCDLATFLIERASQNTTLANYFYWYLVIECEEQENNGKQDSKVRDMYVTVKKMFSQTLTKGNAELQKRKQYLQRQQNFIEKLVKLVKVSLLGF